MQEEFSVTPSFWDQLAPVWDKKPVLIKNALSSPIASTDEMFEAFCNWTDAVKENTSPYPIVYVDGTEIVTNLEDFLPLRRDASLAGFARRLDQNLPDSDFQLFFKSAVHVHHEDIGVRCREVLLSLPKSLGIPPGGVEVETFCGMYTRTATGIHRDHSDNLSFIIDGKKTMLFWPEEDFASFSRTAASLTHERIGSANYEEYLAKAIRITAEPGDCIYWPRSYWHMAISEERAWSTTLNLVFWWQLNPRQVIARAIDQAGLLAGKRQLQAYPLPSGIPQEDAKSLPEIMSTELASYRNLVSSPVLDQIIEETWARIVTTGGLLQPLKPLPKVTISRSEYVCADPKFPIVILPVDDQVMTVISAGNALRVRRSDSVDRLVEMVRSGKTLQVDSLLKETRGDNGIEPEKHDEEMVKLIEFLISNRALRIVTS